MVGHRNLKMNYSHTPLLFDSSGTSTVIVREVADRVVMLDNLVELIAFTPKGSFAGDPDFGFEYWNHEYSNVNYREFNYEQAGIHAQGRYNEATKQECQESIRQSLLTYAPELKQVVVTMDLNSAEREVLQRKKLPSKYVVKIIVEGIIEDGLGTTRKYEKQVVFFMEPTAKKHKTEKVNYGY